MSNKVTEHVVETNSLDVTLFKKRMLDRFNLEKEKMIGEIIISEQEMVARLEANMVLGMRRSLEILYRRYPDLYKLFSFSEAGIDIQYDAEHCALTAGFNKVLNAILLWVEMNPDKRHELTPYMDPLSAVSHEVVMSDDEIFNGRGAGVNAMIKEWAKLADK